MEKRVGKPGKTPRGAEHRKLDICVLALGIKIL